MSVPPTITIRPAWPSEAAEISALALRSKSHWGYDAAFLEACRSDLSVTPETMQQHIVRVGEIRAGDGDSVMGGFYTLSRRETAGAPWSVEHLFVDPPAIGTGLGAALMDHLKAKARAAGATMLEVESDPQAEGFYQRMGFERVGEVPSASIPGRALPLMTCALVAADRGPQL